MTQLVKHSNGASVPATEQTRDNPVYTPRFDIYEKEDELVLWGDLPGVQPNDLDIRFENGQLSIHAKVAQRQENVRYLLTEYGVGEFERSFTVGEAIDSSKIEAELHDGVLTLHLPKTEESKPRRIEVKGS